MAPLPLLAPSLWGGLLPPSLRLAPPLTFTKWPDQAWKAVWRNPVNGEEALYLASHAFAVEGLPEAEGQKLIDELIAFATALAASTPTPGGRATC
jgi:hypothetical protein